MANRHKIQAKAKGGAVEAKKDGGRTEYNAKGSNVMKEAHEKKDGGRVRGFKSGGRLDKRARGGGVSGSGKDMTTSPFSGAHLKGAHGAASNPGTHGGK